MKNNFTVSFALFYWANVSFVSNQNCNSAGLYFRDSFVATGLHINIKTTILIKFYLNQHLKNSCRITFQLTFQCRNNTMHRDQRPLFFRKNNVILIKNTFCPVKILKTAILLKEVSTFRKPYKKMNYTISKFRLHPTHFSKLTW